MILMRTNPLQGSLEGVGPENRDFFGLWKDNEKQSLDFQGPPIPMALVMDFLPSREGSGTKCIYFVPLSPPPPRPNGTKCIYFFPFLLLNSILVYKAH